MDNHNNFSGGDVICLHDEEEAQMMYHPFDPLKSTSLEGLKKEPLLEKVMENGKRLFREKPLKEISQFSRERLNKLPPEFKRFFYPHLYKIGISKNLREERDKILQEHRIK